VVVPLGRHDDGNSPKLTDPEKTAMAVDDRFRVAGVGGCGKGDVVIGIGEDCRDRSAQFASVSPPA